MDLAALTALFRFVLRRDAGSMGIADILLLVLIADASHGAPRTRPGVQH